MIKNLENLFVLDIIEPDVVFGGKFEEATVFRNRICRREIDVNGEIFYRDLERNMLFQVIDKIGYDRVDAGSIQPLSSYYNFLGLPKLNFLENREYVSDKVKCLKKQKRL